MNAKGTILIVDDDPKVRKTLSDILGVRGYAPIAAATGKAALDRVEEEMPAVALIDLRLEDISGLEVMRGIKECCPGTECIVLTGYATQKSAIEAVNLGAYSYVQKPYDMEQLLVTIRRAIEKREAEEALRASEEEYRVLVENANEAIIVVQDGMLKFVNPKATELTGYSKEELTSRPFVEFIHPGDRERMVERHLKRLKGEELPHVYSFRIVDKDGNIKCAEINVVLITWEGRPAALNFLSDITERKRAEEALRESEERYRTLIETSHEIIQSVKPDGHFDFVNKAWHDILGYTKKELSKLSLFDIVHPESLEHCKKMFKKVLAGESVTNAEAKFMAKDGSTVFVEGDAIGRYIDGKLVATHGFFRDVTDRKRAEEALRESEERLAGIIASVTDHMSMIDEHHNIVWANDVAKRLFGPNLIGKKCYAAYHRRDKVCDSCVVAKTFADSEIHEHETEVIGADGKKMDFWCTASVAAWHGDGRPSLVVEVSRDITERKRAEEELQHTLEKLRKTLGATIQAMAVTVETKNPYTAGHQRRVTNLARAIATEMGLSKEQIEGIRMAAVIHDIGKITVPTDILNKPGRLSEHEFGIIKCHPKTGYDILKTVEFPWPIAQIILQHHERMDGSGYPQGLAGEDILLEARILAVADVVEAMASFRPYRPARGLDKALEEISQNRGVLYDAEAVDACLKLFTEKGFEFE